MHLNKLKQPSLRIAIPPTTSQANQPFSSAVDASPVGLGAALTQLQPDGSERAVSYASRFLTAVERRYSQTEGEALAVVWGCERHHMYLIGT